MVDYRLHAITWKNVIDYNWLWLQIMITPCLLTTVWRVIPLEMHFFLLTFTAFGYSNNQREATLTKCKVAKAKFWESLTFMFFYSNVDNLH